MWIQLLILGLIDGATSAEAPPAQAAQPAGPGGRLFKPRRKVIRYSDFESREAYAKALQAAIPMSEVRPIPTIECTLAPDDDEDDDALVFMLVRMLH